MKGLVKAAAYWAGVRARRRRGHRLADASVQLANAFLRA